MKPKTHKTRRQNMPSDPRILKAARSGRNHLLGLRVLASLWKRGLLPGDLKPHFYMTWLAYENGNISRLSRTPGLCLQDYRPVPTDLRPMPLGYPPNAAGLSPYAAGLTLECRWIISHAAGLSPKCRWIISHAAGLSPNAAGLSPMPLGYPPNAAGLSPMPLGYPPMPLG